MAFFGGGGASVDLASPPAIGNTTANTGRFTTVESTSRQFITTADGSVQLGRSGGNALGTNSINIQGLRNANDAVASGNESIAIGSSAKADNFRNIALGVGSISTGLSALCLSQNGQATGEAALAVGYACSAQQSGSSAIGYGVTSSAVNAVALGGYALTANLRAMISTLPFRALYWSGTTTNNTATILNLDGTATNRFTIAANTAAMVDLNIIARRTDTVDKWFSSRRTVAIRRNNANGTAIIGSVQTIGADQTEGSPTWSVAITADDTNEALQVEVTGATGETVSWRVMAFYQVV